MENFSQKKQVRNILFYTPFAPVIYSFVFPLTYMKSYFLWLWAVNLPASQQSQGQYWVIVFVSMVSANIFLSLTLPYASQLDEIISILLHMIFI